MSTQSYIDGNSQYGTIEIDSEFPEFIHRRSGVEPSIYRWRPPSILSNAIPHDFVLEMVRYRNEDGVQRFAPKQNLTRFIKTCRDCGLAILSQSYDISPEQIFTYRAMFLLFEWLQSRQIYLQRNFSSISDLMIRRVGRSSSGSRHVLPEDLGLSARGEGRAWSVNMLVAQGYAAAQESGVIDIRDQDVISHGLFRAGLHNPLLVAEERVLPLLRMALYATTDEPTPSAEIKMEVFSRLSQAWAQHQDDSEAKFEAWYRGGHSNLPKSLANRVPKLPQAAVQRAMFDFGWDAYAYVGQCIRASMQAFRNCLGDNITPQERINFEQVYYPQSMFGGLPLVLLMERSSIIKPLILRLWNDSENQQLVGAFHQVLAWYAMMVEKRRSADCRSKQVMSTQGLPSLDVALTDGDEESWASSGNFSNEQGNRRREALLQCIAIRFNARCSQCNEPLELNFLTGHTQPNRAVKVRGTCPQHGKHRTISVPWNELVEMGQAIQTALDVNEDSDSPEEESPPNNQRRTRPR